MTKISVQFSKQTLDITDDLELIEIDENDKLVAQLCSIFEEKKEKIPGEQETRSLDKIKENIL